MDHKSFPKIPRLENLNVIITEKLDGTNGVVWVDKSNPNQIILKHGSRNRWLTTEDDNHGFLNFCLTNYKYLIRLPHGFHYGEFCGPKIQGNRYQLPEKQFFLFDIRLKELFEDCPVIHTVPFFGTSNLMSIKLKELKEGKKPIGLRSMLNRKVVGGKAFMEGLMLYIPELHKYIKIIYDK